MVAGVAPIHESGAAGKNPLLRVLPPSCDTEYASARHCDAPK
jgi:hypothetical protein